jgi:hypothetical protein
MADRTDSANLLATLGRLLLEHQAMRALLEEGVPDWKRSAIRYCGQQRVRQALQGKLRELSDALQQIEADDPVLALLTTVLEQAVVLHGVLPL